MEFLCPNGHRIQCSDEFAGKAANCPKCGIRFEVPPLPSTPLPPTPPTPSLDGGEKKASDSGIGKEAAIEKVTPAEEPTEESTPDTGQLHTSNNEFEFLCPNGHRLQGPLSLQGYPGQCPECDAKFRIPEASLPTSDELDSESPATPAAKEEAAETVDAKPKLTEATTPVEPIQTAKAANGLAEIYAEESLFETLCKYWSSRPEDATVEIFTDDGRQLPIESFDEEASNQELGVFTTESEQDSPSLAIIPFAKITRIAINGWK